MGIESCSWITKLGLKIIELMVFVIGKKVPRIPIWGVILQPHIIFFTILENFLFLFTSNPISYWNIQEFIAFGYNISLWIYGVKSWFWSKNGQFCEYPQSDYYWGVFQQL